MLFIYNDLLKVIWNNCQLKGKTKANKKTKQTPETWVTWLNKKRTKHFEAQMEKENVMVMEKLNWIVTT